MSIMVAIQYRGFYDVPRMFIVLHRNYVFLFDCAFSDNLDDYLPDYEVYLMPHLEQGELAGSWENIKSKAIRKVGTIPVTSVKFDSTRRKEVNIEVLEELGDCERLW